MPPPVSELQALPPVSELQVLLPVSAVSAVQELPVSELLSESAESVAAAVPAEQELPALQDKQAMLYLLLPLQFYQPLPVPLLKQLLDYQM